MSLELSALLAQCLQIPQLSDVRPEEGEEVLVEH